ncbi:hypothetical protein PS862_03489 [Pseudomonas fluorescens]|uniref:Peptidase M16 C-terminal domain-containing protein n=1 Tax=Pseudomonas fluorescens TaxID=294 RepID=A0A5E7LK22_PSEFL|nr:pitrilysin family protein [Pseudomonas fluorescens]VVP13686.1 hypothetical protein PS862_03489 [Pseudomonas fluorescens]
MSPRTSPIEITLKNGLKIIVLEIPQATGATCVLNYNVSRRDESADNAGINSAFLETLRIDNYENTLKQRFSLSTYNTFTTFKFSLTPDQLGQCFELNARMMSAPVLTENTLKRVIRAHHDYRAEKRHFTSDDSIPVEFDSLCHPIGYLYSPIVTPESAARIDIEQLQQWHQQYYSPGNACLVITGNVKAAEVEKLARQYLDTVPFRPLAAAQELKQLCELDKRHFVLHKATWKPRLLVVLNVPGMSDAIADHSGGALKILSELLRQKLTADLSVSSGICLYEQEKYASLFRVSITARMRDQSLEELEADLNTLIDEFKFNAPPPQELEIARERALASLAKSEDHKALALDIGQLENYQIPFSHLDQRHDDLLNVTAEDIQRTAKTFFTPQRTTVAHILPMQTATRATPVELILDNGLKIIILENPRSESAACSLSYKISSRDESTDNAGINIVLNGTLSKDKNFIDTERFDVWHFDDFTLYSHTTSPDNLNQDFKSLARMMSAPVLTEISMKHVIETKLRQREKNRYFTSDYSTPEAFDALTYPISGYGNSSITPHSAASLDLKQLQQWHQHHYSPTNACLIIVGNVKAQEVETLAKQHFGAVPFRPTALAKEVTELCEPGKRHIELNMDTETPRLLVAFNVPGMVDAAADQSAAALQIISFIFEQNYTAYLPVSSGICAFTQKKHASLFRMSVTANNVDQSLEELEAALIELINEFKLNGVLPEALEMAREQAFTSLVKRESNDSSLAYDLGQLENNKASFTHLYQRHIDLFKVTAEDIQHAANTYFTPQRMTVAHILPMQTPKALI